ncbi:MAG: T9SS type A sorting domain-containing protein [Calditrichota bacterium]
MKTYCWIVLLALAGVVWGQPPDTMWTRIYGGPDIDRAYDIVATDDGGLLVAGEFPFDDGVSRLVMRLNAQGDTVWTRSWGTILESSRAVIHTQDSNYALATYRHAIKFNDQGDTLWTHYIPIGYGEGKGICQTADGHFLIVTQWPSPLVIQADIAVIALDGSGTELWARGIVPSLAIPQRIRPAGDGGCLVSSYYLADDGEDFNVRVDRLNANGDSMWTWIHVNIGDDFGYDAIETTDGGVAVTGSFARTNGASKVFLAKLNNDGEYLWLQRYISYPDCGGRMVLQTTDGGYVIGAHAVASGSGGDFYLIRTDHFGYVLWENTYGTQYTEQSIAMCRTTDNGFAMCGWHLPPDQRYWDACITRIAPDPLPVEDDQIPELPLSRLLVRNYPNPFNATTTLSFSLSHTSSVLVTVFNVLGQAVYEADLGLLNAGEHRQVFDARELPSGVYLARVQAGERSQMRKMVLLR